MNASILNLKCKELKKNVLKRKSVFDVTPRKDCGPDLLYQCLKDNYSRGIISYSKTELEKILLTYIKQSFNINDITLNKVNIGDRPYKFVLRNNDDYYFITRESIKDKIIHITWEPTEIGESIEFKVGYCLSGIYHWDFSEVEAFL